MRNPLTALSLRTQIALVFTGLLATAAVLLSVLLGDRTRQRIEEEASLTLFVVTDNLARIIATDLHQISTEVLLVADAAPLWDQGLTSAQGLLALERLRAARPDVVWVGVTDPAGRLQKVSDTRLRPDRIPDEAWFQNGRRNLHVGTVREVPWISVHVPQRPGAEAPRYLDLSAPIRSRDATLGVLGVYVRWDWLRHIIDTMQPPQSANFELQFFAFDRDGSMIYAPQDMGADLRDTKQRLPFTLSNTDEHYGPRSQGKELPTRVVHWQDGQNYLTAVVRLQGLNAATDLGWYVVARLPKELAYAPARAAVIESLSIGLAVACLGGLLSWFASSRISADLRGITSAVRSVRVDQTENPIPVLRSSAEVRVLSSSLHSMLSRLQRVREDMEATIRQRTSELQAANDALARQARTDALTGLLNRRGFEDQARQVVATTKRKQLPLSLLMVDVDYFKRINDTWGHDVGDVVLKQLANSLRQRLRGSDVLARYGGEEFVVLLPDTDSHGAQAIAQTLVRGIATETNEPYGQITISVGIASVLNHSPDLEDMQRRADAALYEAKGQGRNRACVDPASA